MFSLAIGRHGCQVAMRTRSPWSRGRSVLTMQSTENTPPLPPLCRLDCTYFLIISSYILSIQERCIRELSDNVRLNYVICKALSLVNWQKHLDPQNSYQPPTSTTLSRLLFAEHYYYTPPQAVVLPLVVGTPNLLIQYYLSTLMFLWEMFSFENLILTQCADIGILDKGKQPATSTPSTILAWPVPLSRFARSTKT